WFFCERCLSGGGCEAKDVKQCEAVTLPDRNEALDVAVGAANTKAVRFLVDVAKTNVNGVSGDFKQQPLMAAAYYGTEEHQKIASFLLLRGANINATDLSGNYTALLTAIWKGNTDFAKFLLEKGADPSITAPNMRKRTACEAALIYKRKEIIQFIPDCLSFAEKNLNSLGK
ncbi:ankyrin repeat domain-containing protein, partial [Buttiauxella sp.]|uniref:ankyrin repeat domain-containing protein n=1 Tax=Buttiauxella sp. TaxID=1972222 RepID=UPI003C762FF0